jgi:hypothetical protein
MEKRKELLLRHRDMSMANMRSRTGALERLKFVLSAIRARPQLFSLTGFMPIAMETTVSASRRTPTVSELPSAAQGR